MQHITRDPFLAIEIPLPPLTEQKRIASLLARADRLRHLRRTAHELGESLLQSVFLEMFGDPEFNEKKWQLINLDDVCQNITDGKHGDCQPEPNSGYYFISAKDLRNGVIDYSEAREITYLDFIDTHKRTKLDAGDILLSNSGSIGKVAIANNEERTYRTTFQKSVAILKPKKDLISSGYLFSILKVMSSSLRKISDGSSQKNLLLQDIRAFSIPLPPLSLQEEFAGVVARVESLRGRMSEGERQVEGLFEALLAQSFSN